MRFAFIVIAGVVAASAGHALALDEAALRDPTAVEVSARGVDFRDAASVEAFYRRLRAAARAACDSRVDDRSVTAADRACARQALEAGIASVARPMLTARHQQAGAVFATGGR